MTEVTAAPAPKADPLANVAKALTNSMIVSSAEFAKLKPNKQTEVLVSAGVGKPVIFVESFGSLRNAKNLAEKLLKGDDVSMELEFNDITLSSEENAAIAAVRPILEKIRALKPPYTFQAIPETRQAALTKNGSRFGNGSYWLSEEKAKKYWDRAAPYWAGFKKSRPDDLYEQIAGNGHNYVRVYKEYLQIGCQRIERYQVEELAQSEGWDFPDEAASKTKRSR